MAAGLEIEVKLPVADLDEAVRRLTAAGAVAAGPRTFEDNFILDFADGRLRREQVTLRVRSLGDGGAGLLTLKETPESETPSAADPHETGGRYKVRHERDVPVGAPSDLLALMHRLGLETIYRYQKFRRTFRKDALVITLDELPIGNFMELEGARDDIDHLAATLGFAPQDYIGISYRGVQRRQMQAAGQGGEPVEMLFGGTGTGGDSR